MSEGSSDDRELKNGRSVGKFNILSDIGSIQQNPGMYVGLTDTPTHLFYEVFDNALDEALNGYATKLHICYDHGAKDRVMVYDNGRGILTGNYTLDGVKKAIPEWICTKLFSGEKFDRGVYKLHIGMHGIGLCAVNALSTMMQIYISHDGKSTEMFEFSGAKLVNHSTMKKDYPHQKGTMVIFDPDPQYFETVKLDKKLILRRLQLIKLFHPNIAIEVDDKQPEILPVTKPQDMFKSRSKLPNISIVSSYIKSYITYDLNSNSNEMIGSVNLIPTIQGTHYRAMQRAIGEVWMELRGGYSFEIEDTLTGIQCVFILYIEHTQFSSQTKRELSVRSALLKPYFDTFKRAFKKELLAHPKMIQPCLERFQARRASLTQESAMDYFNRTVKYGNTSSGRTTRNRTVKKLYDCSSTKVEDTELFIVEGESAGGSLLQCRDPKIHAVLPLRGKTLNVTNADLERILHNAEFSSLINSLGCGIHPKEDPSKLRYGKIILLADADPDGQQINALLLGAFAKLLPQLIANGRLYVGVPPLYRQGNNFIWDETQLDKSKQFFRFKGLGEMDPSELKVVAVNKRTRKLEVQTGSAQDLANTISVVGDSSFRKQLLVKRGVIV